MTILLLASLLINRFAYAARRFIILCERDILVSFAPVTRPAAYVDCAQSACIRSHRHRPRESLRTHSTQPAPSTYTPIITRRTHSRRFTAFSLAFIIRISCARLLDSNQGAFRTFQPCLCIPRRSCDRRAYSFACARHSWNLIVGYAPSGS